MAAFDSRSHGLASHVGPLGVAMGARSCGHAERYKSKFLSARRRIRTDDPWLRRPILYPAELVALPPPDHAGHNGARSIRSPRLPVNARQTLASTRENAETTHPVGPPLPQPVAATVRPVSPTRSL